MTVPPDAPKLANYLINLLCLYHLSSFYAKGRTAFEIFVHKCWGWFWSEAQKTLRAPLDLWGVSTVSVCLRRYYVSRLRHFYMHKRTGLLSPSSSGWVMSELTAWLSKVCTFCLFSFLLWLFGSLKATPFDGDCWMKDWVLLLQPMLLNLSIDLRPTRSADFSVLPDNDGRLLQLVFLFLGVIKSALSTWSKSWSLFALKLC